MSVNVVIIGATSEIAREVARIYAAKAANFMLVGRDHARITAMCADLQARGAGACHAVQADLLQIEGHDQLVATCASALGKIDVVLIAHGALPNQAECDADVDQALRVFDLNAKSCISVLHRMVNVLRQQGSGAAVVLSSVAGERGRRSNYSYGAAKAAVTSYASGLRAMAAADGVQVLTVKPGLIDTVMTAHMPRSPLFVGPSRVATSIVRAIEAGKHVIYTPWFWRPIMAIVRSIPEGMFMKIKA